MQQQSSQASPEVDLNQPILNSDNLANFVYNSNASAWYLQISVCVAICGIAISVGVLHQLQVIKNAS